MNQHPVYTLHERYTKSNQYQTTLISIHTRLDGDLISRLGCIKQANQSTFNLLYELGRSSESVTSPDFLFDLIYRSESTTRRPDNASLYLQAEEFFKSIGQADLVANAQKLSANLVLQDVCLNKMLISVGELVKQNFHVYNWLPIGYCFENSELNQIMKWSNELRYEDIDMVSRRYDQICNEYKMMIACDKKTDTNKIVKLAESKLESLDLERNSLLVIITCKFV